MEYDALISTMPLDKLCTVVSGQGEHRHVTPPACSLSVSDQAGSQRPCRLRSDEDSGVHAMLIRVPGLESLPSKAPHFRYSTTHVVGIGLDGPCPEKLRQQCWMYFPEDDCPFYRVTVFSNYSPYHVPKPGRQWSLMAEVRYQNDRSTLVDEWTGVGGWKRARRRLHLLTVLCGCGAGVRDVQPAGEPRDDRGRGGAGLHQHQAHLQGRRHRLQVHRTTTTPLLPPARCPSSVWLTLTWQVSTDWMDGWLLGWQVPHGAAPRVPHPLQGP